MFRTRRPRRRGSESIVDRQDREGELARQEAAERIVRVEIADHPAPTVEVDDERCRSRASGWAVVVDTDVDASRGPGFTDSSMMLQACIEGEGVALGRRALAGIDLEAGRLVQPFGPAVPADFSYFIVYPKPAAERPKVCLFRDWLLEQAAEEAAKTDT